MTNPEIGEVNCFRCGLPIEGQVLRCPSTCMCGGKEGKIFRGDELVGWINGDKAHHCSDKGNGLVGCVDALKQRNAELAAALERIRVIVAPGAYAGVDYISQVGEIKGLLQATDPTILAARIEAEVAPWKARAEAAEQKLEYVLTVLEQYSDFNSIEDLRETLRETLNDASVEWGDCGECADKDGKLKAAEQKNARLRAALEAEVVCPTCEGSGVMQEDCIDCDFERHLPDKYRPKPINCGTCGDTGWTNRFCPKCGGTKRSYRSEAAKAALEGK